MMPTARWIAVLALLGALGCGSVVEDEDAGDAPRDVPHGEDGEARADVVMHEDVLEDAVSGDTVPVDVHLEDAVSVDGEPLDTAPADVVPEVAEDTGVVETSREDAGTVDSGPADVAGSCLVGTTLTLEGSPPRIWVCTVPEAERLVRCPDEWHANAIDCGALGGMFGFYHLTGGLYEFRCNGGVSTTWGTLEDGGQLLTGIPADLMIQVCFTDSRCLRFRFNSGSESVTLDGYALSPTS